MSGPILPPEPAPLSLAAALAAASVALTQAAIAARREGNGSYETRLTVAALRLNGLRADLEDAQ